MAKTQKSTKQTKAELHNKKMLSSKLAIAIPSTIIATVVIITSILALATWGFSAESKADLWSFKKPTISAADKVVDETPAITTKVGDKITKFKGNEKNLITKADFDQLKEGARIDNNKIVVMEFSDGSYLFLSDLTDGSFSCALFTSYAFYNGVCFMNGGYNNANGDTPNYQCVLENEKTITSIHKADLLTKFFIFE